MKTTRKSTRAEWETVTRKLTIEERIKITRKLAMERKKKRHDFFLIINGLEI